MKEIHGADETLMKILPAQQVRQEKTYIPSQFVYAFEHEGQSYAFHTLTKQCLQVSLPSSAKAGAGYGALIASYFLVPDDLDECALYEGVNRLMRALQKKEGLVTYVISPTSGCNARCVYCFEEGIKRLTMTEETAEKAVQYILRTRRANAKIHIKWYGGEPLLGAQYIDYICNRLVEEGVEYTSSMISNGSLITPEIADKMQGLWQLKRIQISMDGAEEDYIRRKNYYHYSNTYHQVIEGVKLLAARDISVSVRCNVDEENWAGAEQFLSDLSEQIPNKRNIAVYYAVLYDALKEEKGVALLQKTLDARERVKEKGFTAGRWYGISYDLAVYHCMADGKFAVAIGPDGALYHCDYMGDESRFGDIEQGITDEEADAAFTRADVTQEKCRKCLFLPECTSFAQCPAQKDRMCKEALMVAIDYDLRRLVEKKEAEEQPAEEEKTPC